MTIGLLLSAINPKNGGFGRRREYVPSNAPTRDVVAVENAICLRRVRSLQRLVIPTVMSAPGAGTQVRRMA